MISKTATLGLSVTLLASTVAFAQEGSVPKGVPHLDHVFVIMMENHGYSQLVNNPNAPVHQPIRQVRQLRQQLLRHRPSQLTNYLEVVGGSNFGVHTDNYPDWHNSNCSPNLATGTVATDNPASGIICPISGKGTDAATPAIDTTNEIRALPGTSTSTAASPFPADPNIVGKTIADQLVANGLSWKSYQESLPVQAEPTW